MKRTIAAVLLACTLTFSVTAARAQLSASTTTVEDDYDDSITHPLLFAAYVAYPVGFLVEWLVGRPFQYIISRPGLDRMFGYGEGGLGKSYYITDRGASQ